MHILLDTHILLWLSDGRQLPTAVRRLLESEHTQLSVSYFTLFEIAIKSASKKLLPLKGYILRLEQLGVSVLPAEQELLGNYRIYREDNRDPFDNMIITHAISAKIALLTADTKIISTKAPGLKIIDARL